jgi:hypothetical protein
MLYARLTHTPLQHFAGTRSYHLSEVVKHAPTIPQNQLYDLLSKGFAGSLCEAQ